MRGCTSLKFGTLLTASKLNAGVNGLASRLPAGTQPLK